MALNNSDFYCFPLSPFYLRLEEGGGGRVVELEKYNENELHQDDTVDLSRLYNGMKATNVTVLSSNIQSLASAEMFSSVIGFGTGNGYLGTGPSENLAALEVTADHGHRTDTSTDTDDKTQVPHSHFLKTAHHEGLHVVNAMNQDKGNDGEQKILRRLAQNREAARKSRMRKKAYVQQLENSRLKLAHLEQELKNARHQVPLSRVGISGDVHQSVSGNGDSAFDLSYARWLDEHQRLICDLRAAVNSQAEDSELRILVDCIISHYDELFHLKRIGAKSNVLHMLSGMWKTPAERYFLSLGGFRCSNVLKILANQIEPLTEQQLVGIRNLQQSSQHGEDALSQGMEALHQSLVDTLSSHASENIDAYMGQMTIAMSKLASLEDFLYQADLLRQQTLHQLQRLLTTHQAARALLAISDYRTKLSALTSLWLARPKE